MKLVIVNILANSLFYDRIFYSGVFSQIVLLFVCKICKSMGNSERFYSSPHLNRL